MATRWWSPGVSVRRLVRRIVLGALVLGVLALLSGLVAAAGLASVWGGVPSAVLVLVLTLGGVLLGGAYGVSSALRGELSTVETALHRVVQPLTARIVGAVPFPPGGLSVDEFERLVDDTAARITGRDAALERPGPPRRSPALVMRLAVWIVRRTLARRFLSRARARGNRVTRETAQAFLGGQLVDLALAGVRFRIAVAHYLIVALASALVLGPLAVRLWSMAGG